MCLDCICFFGNECCWLGVNLRFFGVFVEVYWFLGWVDLCVVNEVWWIVGGIWLGGSGSDFLIGNWLYGFVVNWVFFVCCWGLWWWWMWFGDVIGGFVLVFCDLW